MPSTLSRRFSRATVGCSTASMVDLPCCGVLGMRALCIIFVVFAPELIRYGVLCQNVCLPPAALRFCVKIMIV